MKRTINRLSARQVETLKKPGRHADGGNLYLKIAPDGSRRWVFLYIWTANSVKWVSEVPARAACPLVREDPRRRGSCRSGGRYRSDGGQEGGRATVCHRYAPTFGKMADDYIAAMKPSWRNAKHAAQWVYTLKTLPRRCARSA